MLVEINISKIFTRPKDHREKSSFLCCILVEAFQCTEPESLSPLAFGISKLVLIGDPNQLPATVLSQVTFMKTLTHIYTEHSNNLLFLLFPFFRLSKNNCLNSLCSIVCVQLECYQMRRIKKVSWC